MTYYPDLSPYEYFRQERPRGLNIGWLDAAHEFATGPVDAAIVSHLGKITCYCVNLMRGLHPCNICGSLMSLIYEVEGKKLLVGNGEIRVFSAEGEIFAAPTMLLHYITVHNYLPPPSFLDAVKNGPVPPMQEYFDQLTAEDHEWEETSTHDGRFELRPPRPPGGWGEKQ